MATAPATPPMPPMPMTSGAAMPPEAGGTPAGSLEADGSFCIPPDVVKYLGEKFFKDLVSKAQAEMSGGAEGEMNPFTAMANDSEE